MTASGLRAIWEEGLQDQDKQEGTLKKLNRHFDKDVRCICVLKVWSFGSHMDKHEAQINVNLIDNVAI